MRVFSWNVNGLHATLKDAAHRHGSASAFFSEVQQADIVCFQEAKIQEDKLEKWMACVDGYDSFWAFSQEKKGYSGVVTYVRESLLPLDAKADCLEGNAYYSQDLQTEGRLMLTDHGSFVLLNVYVPNAGHRHEDSSRLEFKLRYLRALRDTCDAIVSSGKHFVLVGDYNLAHEQVDVHPKWNINEIYSEDERAWMDSFLTEYVDLFRHFHPEAKDVYSVWDQKTDARIHNEGVRIDHTVCDRGFLPQVLDANVVKMVPKKWSDHAALTLTLQEQPALARHPPPAICSRNMKQFQEDQRQTKLTALFSRGAATTEAGAAENSRCVPVAGKGDTSDKYAAVPQVPGTAGGSGVDDDSEAGVGAASSKRQEVGAEEDGDGKTESVVEVVLANDPLCDGSASAESITPRGTRNGGTQAPRPGRKSSSKRKQIHQANAGAESSSKQKSLHSFFQASDTKQLKS